MNSEDSSIARKKSTDYMNDLIKMLKLTAII